MNTCNFFLAVMILSSAFSLHAQTGGTYDLSHNVIAGGGGSNSTGGSYKVEGTSGQNIAGTISSGGSFSTRGGFWAFGPQAPTAGSASISGLILTFDGRGIKNVRLILTSPSTGESVHAITGPFGYYSFTDLAVGGTYVITVESKRFRFSPNTRVITLLDELANEHFYATPVN